MSAITDEPRTPALGLEAARRADLDRLIADRLGEAAGAVDRLETLSADAIYHAAAASQSIRFVDAATWFDQTLPEAVLEARSTPTDLEMDEGYRPLRLLASLDGVLGSGIIAVVDAAATRPNAVLPWLADELGIEPAS